MTHSVISHLFPDALCYLSALRLVPNLLIMATAARFMPLLKLKRIWFLLRRREELLTAVSFLQGSQVLCQEFLRRPLQEPGSKRIGTSCENVLVGQRVKVVEDGAARLNVSSSMENTVENLDQTAAHMAENPTIMSDGDYDVFLRIVEAEAGTEDLKGRILVANVILNRVKNDEFPDTVTDVVWDYRYGVPQFSPTYDGRIYQVTVTDKTREAVKQALEGVDYSQGALFFVEKEAAEKKNVAWFEKDLQKLFKYGVHEFYKYPDEVSGKEDASSKDASSPKDDSSSDKNNDQETVVQMVKNDIKN